MASLLVLERSPRTFRYSFRPEIIIRHRSESSRPRLLSFSLNSHGWQLRRYPSASCLCRWRTPINRQRQVACFSSLLSYGPDPQRFFLFSASLGYGAELKQKESQTILCTSAAVHDEALVGDENLLRRLIRWLRSVLHTCWEALLLSCRGTQIAFRLSPLLIMTPASMVSAHIFVPPNKKNIISDWTWSYVMTSMQALGPGFVKACQWVATRRDIFPPHICDRLSALHDHGKTHSWSYTDKALRDAFGEDYPDKGLRVDKNDIIGCGSAAQVYRGTLVAPRSDSTPLLAEKNRESRPVAIKVLHPQLARSLERDLWFMRSIADFLHYAIPTERFRMLNLPRATENFASVLRRQEDLRIEADNLKKFRANFYCDDKNHDSSVVFPQPVEEWIGKEVLVEDLVDDAIPISNYLTDSSELGVETCKALASTLLRSFLKMVFLDNFVHGDLHPGNVLVQTSVIERPPTKQHQLIGFLNMWHDTKASPSKTEVKRTIVFLDAGIATSLSPDDQKNLRDLFRAVILNEGETAGRLMVERAKYERCSQIEGEVDKFARGIGEIVSEFHDRRKEGLTLGAVRIGSLLCRVLDLCRLHGVEIDPDMASIVISTLVLEGLGRSLEPNLNLIDFAIPFVIGRGRV